MRKIVIMGAAGRDFHVVFRDDPDTRVVAFTAAQIPGIENRIYPPSLAGPLYLQGIPIRPEAVLTRLQATPPVAMAPHVDNTTAMDSMRSALQRAGYSFEL